MSRRQILLVAATSACLGYVESARAQFDLDDATFIGAPLPSAFDCASGAVQISSTELIVVGDNGDVARISTGGSVTWHATISGAPDTEGVTYNPNDGYAYIVVECSGTENMQILRFDLSTQSVVRTWTIPLTAFDTHGGDDGAGMDCTPGPGTEGAEAITFIPDTDHTWADATDPTMAGLLLIGSQETGHVWWVDVFTTAGEPAYSFRDTMASVAGNQGIAMDTTGEGNSEFDLAGLEYDAKADRLYVLKDGSNPAAGDRVVVVDWRLCVSESSCEGTEILNRFPIEDILPPLTNNLGDDPEGIAIYPQGCSQGVTLRYDVFLLFDDPPAGSQPQERAARYDYAVTYQCP